MAKNPSLRLQYYLRHSGLFDDEWYRKNYSVSSHIDGLEEYSKDGWKHRHSPGPLFDAPWYLREYPDVAHACVDPLQHFVEYGAVEGRKINASGQTLWNLSSVVGERARSILVTANLVKRMGRIRELNLAERQAVAVSDLFDAPWYRSQNADISSLIATHSDCLDHYLASGWLEGRNPSPSFDQAWYALRYKDAALFRQAPLAHYVTTGSLEGRKCGVPPHVRGAASEMLKKMSLLEPEIASSERLQDVRFLEVADGNVQGELQRAVDAMFAQLRRRYDQIIFVPWLVRGGADRVAVNILRAAQMTRGAHSVLLAVTDASRLEAQNWLDDGTDVLVFPSLTPNLDHKARVTLVRALIAMVCPKAIVIVNSAAAWEAVKRHGPALAAICDIYAALFCDDFSVSGNPSGYANVYFRQCLPNLRRVYFDNQTFASQLAERHGLPKDIAARLTLLRQPALEGDSSVAASALDQKGDFRVLWAGRLCRQKNLQLLVKIAAAAPNFQFCVYGSGEEAETQRIEAAARVVKNLVYEGPYDTFSGLPTETFGALLYTSLWDGLPNVLLAAARCGLPIVASNVGGIAELVDNETGWLIDDFREDACYVNALKSIHDNPKETSRRLQSMRARLSAHHSWDGFVQQLLVSPSPLDISP